MNLLNNIIIESLYDWPFGTIMGVLSLLVILALLGLLIWGCFIAVDSWFLPRSKGMGKIVSKVFTPAHYGYILVYNDAIKTSMPQPIYYSDDWSVNVEVARCRDSISISENLYLVLKEGDSVFAEYVTGRISGSFYLKGISRM